MLQLLGMRTHPLVVCHDSLLTALEEVETGEEPVDRAALLSYMKTTGNSGTQASPLNQMIRFSKVQCSF